MSVEHISKSLRCFQKESEQREAFKSAAKQLMAKNSASGLLSTLRASGIMDCRRFSSASGFGNTETPASAGRGSNKRLLSVDYVRRKGQARTFQEKYKTLDKAKCHIDVNFGAVRPDVEG